MGFKLITSEWDYRSKLHLKLEMDQQVYDDL